ncbi:ESX secretion-associated protein EspG [Actinoalloteichus hymeniacidonis]|uniref:EspG family n=1 Tax=Actinoalloteichus hymeniacidonis TaxID=340345 RepID=A0AAC9HP44_9PSEU|nr:ESX secretion-associated protein EspG [Actinoalloteichus hymeniacidonis]AOS62391.1 EspG family [Actinoalloteichus hymeniacidonis]MBB5909579.1 hypothetical protein [Actinoalloteichus hymeniacidonis]
MLRSKITISNVAYDVLWEQEKLEDKHLALRTKSPGRTFDERRELVDQAWQELGRLGLARGREAHPDLVDALHLIKRAAIEFYGWFSSGKKDTRSALAVAHGEQALLAELVDDELSFAPLRSTGLIDGLVSALPPNPGGRGRSFNFPKAAFSGGDKPSAQNDLGFEGSSGGNGGTDIKALKQLLGQPRSSAGQLYVARRDRFGKRHRVENALSFFDPPPGRYLAQETPGPDGTTWMVVAPANARALSARLSEMVGTLPS